MKHKRHSARISARISVRHSARHSAQLSVRLAVMAFVVFLPLLALCASQGISQAGGPGITLSERSVLLPDSTIFTTIHINLTRPSGVTGSVEYFVWAKRAGDAYTLYKQTFADSLSIPILSPGNYYVKVQTRTVSFIGGRPTTVTSAFDTSPEASVRVIGDETLLLGNTTIAGNLTVYGNVIALEEEAIGARVFRQDTAPDPDTTFANASFIADDIDALTGVIQTNLGVYSTSDSADTGSGAVNSAISVGQYVSMVRRSLIRLNTTGFTVTADSAKVRVVVSADNSATDFVLKIIAPTDSLSKEHFNTSMFNEFIGWLENAPADNPTVWSDDVSTAGISVGDTLTFTLNAAGIAALTQDGTHQLWIVSEEDMNASAPIGNEYVTFNDDAVYMQIFYTDAEEVSEINLSVGDIWIDTNDGDKPYTWTGSAWSPAFTSIDGGYIQTNTVNLNRLTFTPLVAAGEDSSAIIATINASSEGITISAGNIAIDGTTTFSSGYDPSGKVPAGGAAADVNANVTTIDGGKITANSVSVNTLDFRPVNRDSVIASINASPDSSALTIQGSKININGLTTFAGGYDPSEKTFTLRADEAPTIEVWPLLEAGDRWIDTNDGNRPYSWDGDSWEADLTIIDGGSILTGYIRSTVIRADSITAGTFTGLKFRTAASGTRLILDGVDNRLEMLDGSDNTILMIDDDIPAVTNGPALTIASTADGGGMVYIGEGLYAGVVEDTLTTSTFYKAGYGRILNNKNDATGVFTVRRYRGSGANIVSEWRGTGTHTFFQGQDETKTLLELRKEDGVGAALFGDTGDTTQVQINGTSLRGVVWARHGFESLLGVRINEFSTDGTLADSSATAVPTESAVKAYVKANMGGGATASPSGTVTSETSFGASASAGAASTYSRGDHTHGTPANPVTGHESTYNHSNYNTAYTHSQTTTGNPHNLDAADVGAAASSHSHNGAGITGGSAGDIFYWNSGSSVSAWGSPATAGVATSGHTHSAVTDSIRVVTRFGDDDPGTSGILCYYKWVIITNGIISAIRAEQNEAMPIP